MVLLNPDRSGILCFFPLKKQRYSGERDHCFLKMPFASVPKMNHFSPYQQIA
jgi:hypothetical protein